MVADTVIVNCSILTTDGLTPGGMGVAIRDGKIVAIGEAGVLPAAEETIDVGGRVLAPGIVDDHVHDRSPGFEYKEDWETVTAAAAAGGVTTILGHPNNDPLIDSPDHLALKYELAERDALVDFQCFAAPTPENLDQVDALVDAGAVGFMASIGSNTFTDGELLEAFEAIGSTGRRFGLHAENGDIVAHYTRLKQASDDPRPIDHCLARPSIAEVEGISRVIMLANYAGCPLHVFSVSTGAGAEQVVVGKEAGVDVTAETLPHYLWFSDRVMHERGNVARISPPIRSAEERDRLWTVGVDGAGIDCLATDHAPHTDEEKGVDDPFGDPWSTSPGFPGLETAVPAMLTFVHRGRLPLERWIAMHSVRPAKVWGLYPEKGSLGIGTDADLVVLDLDREWTLDRDDLHSKSTATPFDGETFVGAVTHTFVRGELVFADGDIVGMPGFGTRVPVIS